MQFRNNNLVHNLNIPKSKGKEQKTVRKNSVYLEYYIKSIKSIL